MPAKANTLISRFRNATSSNLFRGSMAINIAPRSPRFEPSNLFVAILHRYKSVSSTIQQAKIPSSTIENSLMGLSLGAKSNYKDFLCQITFWKG